MCIMLFILPSKDPRDHLRDRRARDSSRGRDGLSVAPPASVGKLRSANECLKSAALNPIMEERVALTRAKKRFVFLSLYARLTSVQLEPALAQNLTQSTWPTKEWLTSTPEEQGMDSTALATLVGFGATHSFDSLLVARHGRLVLDAYYAPYTADIRHAIFSCTKAVVGTLAGMAYKDGLLDRLDRPVFDYFSERSIANVDERKKAITVQNLLDMTSGLDWDEGFMGGKMQSLIDLGRSHDWTQFILDRPMAHRPGEFFYYDGGNPDLLSAIIGKLSGKRAEDYAKDKLFDPLGIANWRWGRNPQGRAIGYAFLSLLPRDMAKIGYLYLRHGEWEGKPILPPGWADILNHTTVSMNASFDPGLRYSDFFWVLSEKNVYMATGYHGQLIVVFPNLDIVAVVTARNYVPFGKLIDQISDAVRSDSALPPDPDASRRLANAIGDVAAETPAGVRPTPAMASVISGKTYEFPDNAIGIKSLTLFPIDDLPHFEIEMDLNIPVHLLVKFDIPIGLDGRYRKVAPTASGVVPAAKGAWLNEQTFMIDAQYIGSGLEQRLSLSFVGRQLTLRGKDGDGHEVSVDGEEPTWPQRQSSGD